MRLIDVLIPGLSKLCSILRTELARKSRQIPQITDAFPKWEDSPDSGKVSLKPAPDDCKPHKATVCFVIGAGQQTRTPKLYCERTHSNLSYSAPRLKNAGI